MLGIGQQDTAVAVDSVLSSACLFGGCAWTRVGTLELAAAKEVLGHGGVHPLGLAGMRGRMCAAASSKAGAWMTVVVCTYTTLYNAVREHAGCGLSCFVRSIRVCY